jgi:hypothetical protein
VPGSGSTLEVRHPEGVVRVFVGVALTLAVWTSVPLIGSLAIAVSPPFVLAVVVAFSARVMRWSVRTARASIVTLIAFSLVSDAFYLRDRGRSWTVTIVVLFDVLAIGATWLAWRGGIVISESR